MNDTSAQAIKFVPLLLLWHVVAAGTIFLSSILFSGIPVWRLESNELNLFSYFTVAYLAAAVLGTLYAFRTGSWRLIASSIIGLAAFGAVFLVLLITRMQYARSTLLELFALAMVLNLGPLIFRWIPRAAVSAGVSVVLALLLLSILDKGDLLRWEPAESESRRVETTALYNVVTTEFRGRIPMSKPKGGGLTRMGDRLLLASGDGRLYTLKLAGESQVLSVSELPFSVPLNTNEFLSETHESIDERRFRVGDVLVQDLGETYRIFASHHYWNVAEGCFVVRVSSTTVDQDANPLQEQPGQWATIFESTPCLGVLEAKSGEQPENPKFAGHQMGGRLALLDAQSLLVAIGDHRFDGFNSARLLPQDTAASYGKTIMINLADNSSEIFSLGHRNPQGLAVDSAGSIWLTEHGPQGGDELNRITRNSNYGWPLVTFGTEYGSFVWPLNEKQGSHDDYDTPVYAWSPGLGISNLIVVEKSLFPLWQNDLMISTLATGMVIRARIHDGRLIHSEAISIGTRIRDLVELDTGTIVLWTDESTIITINPADSVQLSKSERGRMLFASCSGCHAVNDGQTHGIGPDLAGVVGRRIASAVGYRYSDSLANLTGEWTEASLDAFIADPQTFASGNVMTSAQGVSDQAARTAIIEFLKTQ